MPLTVDVALRRRPRRTRCPRARCPPRAPWRTPRGPCAGSTLTNVPGLVSLNATMISVPPLKSIVQFMYSPRALLLMNKRADGGGHEQDRDDRARLELRDEREVVSRRQQVAELVRGCSVMAGRLRSTGCASWPFFRATAQSKRIRVTQMFVVRVVKTPTSSITAKPLIGPEPYCRSTQPAAAVVS